MTATGIDRIGEYARLFKGRRTGLMTNPTGITSTGESSLDVLARHSDLVALFAPEHGVRGDRQDGAQIVDYVDERTGIPVHSVYGERREPRDEDLRGLDVLCYDIQDVGSRFYTFIYSMANAMKAASRAGITFVVFDRPDPITGLHPQGSAMTDSCRSFVGMYDIPQRYSLTIGELAMLVRDMENLDVDLQLIPMAGWSRDMFYDQTGLVWVAPSPNIPVLDAAILYNGTCFFEGTNLSEGRGTTHPFENIGAPFVDPYRWAAEIAEYGLEGLFFRPCSFIPMYSKYSGQVCHGLHVHITDRTKVDPLRTGIVMLLSARRLFADEFRFTSPKHETGDWTVDLFYGSPLLRDDDVTVEDVLEDISSYGRRYEDGIWRDYWLYS